MAPADGPPPPGDARGRAPADERPDLGALSARFCAALHAAGLPVGPDRAVRFAAAVRAVRPRTLGALRSCALATLTSDPADRAVFDPVFDTVFGGLADPAEFRGDRPPPAVRRRADRRPSPSARPARHGTAARPGAPSSIGSADPEDGDGREAGTPSLASAEERLGARDFAELSAAELAELLSAMGRFRMATPLRRTRRTVPSGHGERVDLRRALRAARRTGGDPVRLPRRTRRRRPRRLVVLCDISGSMQPYARALLQLVYCAGGGARAEVFTFATRLTRLTPALGRGSPATALDEAVRRAPDWSGGTRIGEALRRFLDEHGHRGMARGAVVLVVSDGWETGDPALLGTQLARLRRLAHRIVWANPRSGRPGYRPLVGGMAAAWPYCDAVVSAHRLDAVADLVTALRGPATGAAGSG
jgi:uncharacterized protein